MCTGVRRGARYGFRGRRQFPAQDGTFDDGLAAREPLGVVAAQRRGRPLRLETGGDHRGARCGDRRIGEGSDDLAGQGAQIALQGPGVGRRPLVPARKIQSVRHQALDVLPAAVERRFVHAGVLGDVFDGQAGIAVLGEPGQYGVADGRAGAGGAAAGASGAGGRCGAVGRARVAARRILIQLQSLLR